MRHCYPTTVCEEGVHHTITSVGLDHGALGSLVLLGFLQKLDPVQQLDDVDFTIWRNRIHAPHILEEKVISHKHHVLDRLYGT